LNKIEVMTMSEVEIAPRIVVNEAIHPGRPVIEGTRIPVSLLLGSLSAGMTVEEIVREYEVVEEDIRAAVEYARMVVAQESVYPLLVPARP
jgi:uncharacterized protein (DUF433 family)